MLTAIPPLRYPPKHDVELLTTVYAMPLLLPAIYGESL